MNYKLLRLFLQLNEKLLPCGFWARTTLKLRCSLHHWPDKVFFCRIFIPQPPQALLLRCTRLTIIQFELQIVFTELLTRERVNIVPGVAFGDSHSRLTTKPKNIFSWFWPKFSHHNPLRLALCVSEYIIMSRSYLFLSFFFPPKDHKFV